MTTPRDPHEPVGRHEELLRRALAEQADRVTPAGDGLTRIRSRIDARRARLRWLRPAAALAGTAVVVAAVFLAGGLLQRDDESVIGPGPVASGGSDNPTQQPSPTGTPSASTAPVVTVPVYYLGDSANGPRLYREFARATDAGDPVTTALTVMLAGHPADPDYTSLWPAGTAVLSTTTTRQLITVDLSAAATTGSGGAAAEQASVQQLVWTATAAAQETVPVQILVAGRAPTTLWGHVDTSKPVSRAAQVDVLAAVWVQQPAQGATLTGPVTISGTATVFEATVSLEISKPDGTVVKQTFITASAGAPERGTWEATVTLPPGDYVVTAFESSNFGSHLSPDSKAFTVR